MDLPGRGGMTVGPLPTWPVGFTIMGMGPGQVAGQGRVAQVPYRGKGFPTYLAGEGDLEHPPLSQINTFWKHDLPSYYVRGH